MRTVILGPWPPEIDALIARRHALGQDIHDEVWQGEYHMAPAAHPQHGAVASELALLISPRVKPLGLRTVTDFNLGTDVNYRVPDLGVIDPQRLQLYMPTAALVVEVVSPGDESLDKFDHFAAHHVGEVLIVDPLEHRVSIFVLRGHDYEHTDHSELLDMTSADIVAAVDWPPAAAV